MAKKPIYARPRYVRQRVYDRFRRGIRSLVKFFVDTEGARLASSATARTFTVNASTDLFSSTSHGFVTGGGPIRFSSTVALPAPLVAGQLYWPIRVDANSFRAAINRDNAGFGVYVDIEDTGSGTHSAFNATSGPAILERLRQGTTPQEIRAATDIDNL